MTNRLILGFYVVILMSLLSSCGGKIAKTGVGSVVDVNDWGVFSFAYPDGFQSWKRFGPETMKKDIKVAQQNVRKPARFVETPKGGSLTFPDGKTILYYDNK
ncbi:MAG: hypothetical protein M0T73_11080 [Deltaproteobacteria bacterium]|nr:hypothetical protein [Deltaproteobacteria bacterium]